MAGLGVPREAGGGGLNKKAREQVKLRVVFGLIAARVVGCGEITGQAAFQFF